MSMPPAPVPAGVPAGYPTNHPPVVTPPAVWHGPYEPFQQPYQQPYQQPFQPAPEPARFLLPTRLKDHMSFFQVPGRRWWWGLIGLAAYVGFYLVVMVAAGVVMIIFNPSMITTAASGQIKTTPSLFAINNIALSLDIVVCTLIAWLFFKQGFGWLVSVIGRFRWKWFGLTLGVFAIGYVVETFLEFVVFGPDEMGWVGLEMKPYTWFMVGAIVLTTPFQCAGEEFQSRALLPRLITAIVPHRRVGLVLSALIPSTVFMLLHGATDPWLNVNYMCVALMMWWLAYRTGGIEASIGLHIVNNFFSEWTMPFSDFSDMFDRSEGTGSPVVIGYLFLQFVLVVIIDLIARRRGMVRMSAPGAATPEVMKPRQWVTETGQSITAATQADLPRIDDTIREPAPFAEIPTPSSFVPSQYPPGQPTPTWSPPDPAWAPPDPAWALGRRADGLFDHADQGRADAEFADTETDQAGHGLGL